jgi:hypothetical protein
VLLATYIEISLPPLLQEVKLFLATWEHGEHLMTERCSLIRNMTACMDRFTRRGFNAMPLWF